MSSEIKLEKDVLALPDKPKMYMVVMHNDHYTTMDFVVMVLMKVFLKSIQDATNIMMTIHKTGKCDVGAYTYDIAITKKMQALIMSEEKGFPLLVTVSEII